MFSWCCGNADHEITDDMFSDLISKLQDTKTVLLEFKKQEGRLGLKGVDCVQLIDKTLEKSSRHEVPYAALKQIYGESFCVDANQVMAFLNQPFFFAEKNLSSLDYNKVVLFNLLHGGGEYKDKAAILVHMIDDPNTHLVENMSFRLIHTIENIIKISSIVVSQVIEHKKVSFREKNHQTFQELKALYSTNESIIRDFSVLLVQTYLFPDYEQRSSFTKAQCVEILSRSSFLLLKPYEVRKRFTEYVFTNRQQASNKLRMLPGPYNVGREQEEESKDTLQFEYKFSPMYGKPDIRKKSSTRVLSQSHTQEHAKTKDSLHMDIQNELAIKFQESAQMTSPLKLEGMKEFSSNSHSSLLLANKDKDPTEAFLIEQFGDQFIQLKLSMQHEGSDPLNLEELMNSNRECLQSFEGELQFPDFSSFPSPLKEIFETFKLLLKKDELEKLLEGRLLGENVINVYMKILETVNSVNQSSIDFNLSQADDISIQYPFKKIKYFNTNIWNHLSQKSEELELLLMDFFTYDEAILPYFVNYEESCQVSIVNIKIKEKIINLIGRDNESDNQMFSDAILDLLAFAGQLHNNDYDQNDIEGNVECLKVKSHEEMVVGVCFVAENMTFEKPLDFSLIDYDLERQKILHTLLSLLRFH